MLQSHMPIPVFFLRWPLSSGPWSLCESPPHLVCFRVSIILAEWLAKTDMPTRCDRTLFLRGDKYETSDVVFGVKSSLVVDLQTVDAEKAAQYGVPEGALLLQHDFVLASTQETEELRDKNAIEAMKRLGLRTKLVDHLPVPDLD